MMVIQKQSNEKQMPGDGVQTRHKSQYNRHAHGPLGIGYNGRTATISNWNGCSVLKILTSMGCDHLGCGIGYRWRLNPHFEKVF